MRKIHFACLVGLCLFVAEGLHKDKFIKIYFPDQFAVTAELAVSDEERQLGLMYREKINPDQGMLFIFEEEGLHPFWMKNTLISLDILWLDNEKRIIHIEENVPPCTQDPCPSYVSRIPARYVLELKNGSVEGHGLKLYDRLEFILPRDLSQPYLIDFGKSGAL